MDNYKETLLELNELIREISKYEKQAIDNKHNIDLLIIKTKEYLNGQVEQLEHTKTMFKSNTELIEEKFSNMIKDIHNQIESDFKVIIDDKLSKIKSVLNPLEVELKESNIELEGLQDFFMNNLKTELDANYQRTKDIHDKLVNKIEADYRSLATSIKNNDNSKTYFDKLFKILGDIRQGQDTQLMNLKNMQISENERNDLIETKLDELIENQNKILKIIKG